MSPAPSFEPTTDVEQVAPDRWILDGGYVVLLRPDHPMAGPKGTVLEHRMVLYDHGIDPTGWHVHHLTPFEDEEYCGGCGQIGCGWC